MTPEENARQTIDKKLHDAGWAVQDYKQMNLGAAKGVAVREFPLKTGFADYLLFVDRKAIGVLEAKAEGTTLSGITHQSQSYSAGLPDKMKPWHNPLPYLYESTGIETLFTDFAIRSHAAVIFSPFTNRRHWRHGPLSQRRCAPVCDRCHHCSQPTCGNPKSRLSPT